MSPPAEYLEGDTVSNIFIPSCFLAPSGAQVVGISVCLAVLHGDSLSRALNLHLSGSGLSKVNLRLLSGLS